MLFVVAAVMGANIPYARSAEGCTPAVARVASIEGAVQLRRARGETWQAAQSRSALCAGDQVRVGARSRAGLVLRNETTLRLDQSSTLTLRGDGLEGSSLLDLLSGALHVITRTPRPFKVKTPYVNAAVDGTEFLVDVSADEARIAVFEGRVSASNEFGILSLVAGEIALVAMNQAPRKEVMVRPVDAVQWALYYPNIIDYRLGETMRGSAAEPALRESIDLYRQGRLAEAILRTDNVAEGRDDARFLTYRAGLLLMVGRVDEAKPEIQHALAVDPRYSDALALEAVIAVVQNDKEQASTLAAKAVEFGPSSPAAHMALSYAQQAQFKIEEASASVLKALELDPDSALAWARLAELQMSSAKLDAALESAQRAVRLDPGIAKTQSVLGFAHLTRLDTKAAKQAFGKAIELDQAEPLARLGLGLAKIREGDLSAGREEIEIAVSLDPGNSLIRSYMGKAYYEEKRDKLAGGQFELAKRYDPRDPTPWFYDAIRKQTENRPVEALRDLEKSIELNDNRAVYRSRLLLDEDRASRGASLANVYSVLGFGALAVQEAAKSLGADSRNVAAHQFLAESFADRPRQRTAAESEELQYRLRESAVSAPPSALRPADTVIPQSAPRIGVVHDVTPIRSAFNEYSSLFERRRTSIYLDGISGEQGSFGNQVIATGNDDRWSFSLGQASVATKGSSVDTEFRQDALLGLLYFRVTPNAVIYAEGRDAKTSRGDVISPFDTDVANPVRLDGRVRATRLAARINTGDSSDLLVTTARQERDLVVGFRNAPSFVRPVEITERADSHEVLWSYSKSPLGLSIGGSQIRGTQSVDTTFAALRRAPLFDSVFAYGYFVARALRLGLQGGFSEESFNDGQLRIRRWNPKVGVIWTPATNTTLRFGATRTLDRPAVSNQTIEPTQVAGFSQFFDDLDGSTSTRYGGAIDQRFWDRGHLGLEVTRRQIRVPFADPSRPGLESDWQERRLHGYSYWWISSDRDRKLFPGLSLAASVDYEFERLDRTEDLTGDEGIRRLTTRLLPLRVSLFPFDATSIQFTATRVLQSGQLQVGQGFPIFDVNSRLWVMDLGVLFRVPRYQAAIEVGVKNLFDRSLEDFQESDAARPRFAQRRLAFARVSVRF